MSTTREKIYRASIITLSTPNRERLPVIPGPGTSSRIIPTAISTRPRSFHYELQGSRRKACCEAPRRRNLEGHMHKRPPPGFRSPSQN
ncbi:hypothetical protein F2Q69_00042887 [Brassica cretica]|uniref:Uncharacterized protein n=1 Tax=Brassica cretica TaxID=69181 RepID=A0A8S9NMT9_BRACR|nr:hypothetical protein F2Q69_00042887 [Brassica cretica]